MNTAQTEMRTLDVEELDQVSGGLSAFGYYVNADMVNYGDGDKLHVSWGKEGGSYNFKEFDLNCQ